MTDDLRQNERNDLIRLGFTLHDEQGRVEHMGQLRTNLINRQSNLSEAEKEKMDEYGAKNKRLESMDFIAGESITWWKHQIKRGEEDTKLWWNETRRTTTYRFMLIILTGAIIALIGVGADLLTNFMTEAKLHSVLHRIHHNEVAEAFFTYIALSMAYALGAALLCAWEPSAAGSGISEIKAYLNGIKLRSLLRYTVLVPKVLGMCLSCSSGLPLGKEGPMVHIGAIVGAALSQGKTSCFGTDTSWTKLQSLRSDVSKRDYVTFGAAAGIAAAFRAPIGGILFTLEEGASFWSTELTLQNFLCATTTLIATSLFFLGREIDSGMITFGSFDNLDDGKMNFHTSELLIFAIMGVCGGLFGAFFVRGHARMHAFRAHAGYNESVWKRIAEVLCVTLIMSIFAMGCSLLWTPCTKVPNAEHDWTEDEKNLLDDLVRFQCDDGEFNQVASLFLAPPHVALRQLFHFREYDGSDYTTFSSGALVLFFVPYFFLSIATAGLLVPVGLFVPSLLSGAAFGRLVGHLANQLAPAGSVADSGTYALVGAAAILGGVGRMTIAGTVILLEACGNTAYLLPLLVTFGAARYSGNIFSESIYDVIIELRKLPFLSENPIGLGIIDYHPVADFMTSDVVAFKSVERVGHIYEVLMTTEHNGFPIVSSTGHLEGFVLRKHLTTLMQRRAFSYPVDKNEDDRDMSVVELRQSKPIPLSVFEENYPRYPTVDEIDMMDSDLDMWLDCRPYMDISPPSINHKASIGRTYRMFRTMGLRHLVVVDVDDCIVGIITRHNLIPDAIARGVAQNSMKGRTRAHEFGELEHLPPAYVDPDAEKDEKRKKQEREARERHREETSHGTRNPLRVDSPESEVRDGSSMTHL